MKTVATIEARMGSSRLPGKVLLPAAGVPMIGHLVSRLLAVERIDEIVVATTTDRGDDVLEDWASQNNVAIFRGSAHDVMGRVINAAKSVDADLVVEITGDCPIIDPDVVDLGIRTFLANSVDYVSNVVVPSYPIGMDVQVFMLDTLEKSYSETSDPLDHEHVTRHIRQNPAKFSSLHMIAPKGSHYPGLGLTLDEPSDYLVIKHIIENLQPPLNSSCEQIINFLNDHPEILALNKAVYRKGFE